MAGNYPDVPGHRIPWDRDGTVLFRTDYGAGGTVSILSSADRAELNDEDSGAVLLTGGGTYGLGWVFPEARDIVGYALWYNKPFSSWTPMSIETSTNTTNGVDGTWTNRGAWVEALVQNDLRDAIQAVNWPGVKGIRIRANQSGSGEAMLKAAHFYDTSMDSEPDRLLFYLPSSDAEVGGAYFDWGDTPRNAVVTRTFRIHNPSAQTAVDVTLTTEALTVGSPSLTSEHEFSLDGTTYSSSLNIGNLAPGTTSPVVTVRRTVSASAPLSLWWARIVASASSYI